MKWVRSKFGGEGVPGFATEKKSVVLLGDAVTPEAVVSGSCSDGRWFSDSLGEVMGLGPGAGLVAAASVGNFVVCDPSLAKGLFQRSFDFAGLSCGEERPPLVLDLKPVLVSNLVLEPVLVLKPDSALSPNLGLVLDPDSILDLDSGLVPKLRPAVSRGGLSGEGPVEQRGGLSVEQRKRKDFDHVFLEMFPDSDSCL